MQDEIARKIAEALRITLIAAGAGGARRQADRQPAGLRPVPARQELRAPGHAPGPRVRAADVRERGGARPAVRARLRGDRQRLRAVPLATSSATRPGSGAPMAASQRAMALQPDLPEVQVAKAWVPLRRRPVRRRRDPHRATRRSPASATARAPTTCSGARLFAAGRYQEVVDMAEERDRASGEDYNVYVPITNALGALGKNGGSSARVRQRRIIALGSAPQARCPRTRGRTLLATDATCSVGRAGGRDARGELLRRGRCARTRRWCALQRGAACSGTSEPAKSGLEAIRRPGTPASATPAGRRDPDLAILHGDPEFDDSTASPRSRPVREPTA